MEVPPHALYTNTAQAIAAVFCGFTKELYITYEVNKRAHVYVMNPESFLSNFRGSLHYAALFYYKNILAGIRFPLATLWVVIR